MRRRRGSRRLPEDEGNDLRRSIQKFFARNMDERDFHAFEAVQLGLQLPLVMPLMPVVSVNTSGARRFKSGTALQSAGPNEPVHYDSRVDKFKKGLQFVRRQFTGEELKQWDGKSAMSLCLNSIGSIVFTVGN